MDLKNATRASLICRINVAIGDIHYIQCEIARIKGRRTKPRRIKVRASRRQPLITTLRENLQDLLQKQALLHSELVRMRGEDVFRRGSGLDILAKKGIVSAPRRPTSGKRGRPSTHILGDAIVNWVDFFKIYYPDWTTRRALTEVNSLLNTSVGETTYYRERNRAYSSTKNK